MSGEGRSRLERERGPVKPDVLERIAPERTPHPSPPTEELRRFPAVLHCSLHLRATVSIPAGKVEEEVNKNSRVFNNCVL